MKRTWTCAIVLGSLTVGITGCGGGSNSVTPASQVYVRGAYSGTFDDVHGVFGQGTNATATITYNDTNSVTNGQSNGQLVFPNNVTIPIIVNTFPYGAYQAFEISLPSAPTQYLVSCYYNGTIDGLSIVSTNNYSGTCFEFTYANGNATYQGTATMTVTY